MFRGGQEEDMPLNIIVILADDPGWADVANDNSRIDTPNLLRLKNRYRNTKQCLCNR